MDSVTHSQQLCPLRSYAPNFLSENPPTRNRSYSPQPPPRKRLYSDDFNNFLMDVDSRPDPRDRFRQPFTLEPRDPYEKGLGEPMPTETRFPDDAFVQAQKSQAFFGQEEPEEPEQIGETGAFGNTAEEFVLEGILLYSGGEPGKDDRHKHHFQEIFDANDREAVLLGKREFGEKTRRAKAHATEPRREKQTRELKVEEHSAYVFQPKRVKSGQSPVEFTSPKHVKKKQARAEQTMRVDTRGSGMQG